MQKRTFTIILLVCTAALIALTAVIYLTADRTGPVIDFGNETAEYTDGETNDQLLQGVTASDDKDGDVTSSLRVISVIKSTDGTTATIVYTAKDSSHNVTRETRLLHVAGTAQPTEGTSEEVTSGINDTDAASQQAAAEAEAAQAEAEAAAQQQAEAEAAAQQAAADPEAQAVAEEQAAIAALPAGSPSITLSTHYVTLNQGDTFSFMSYIASLTDDVDSSSRLAQRIEIGGDTVNTSQPGTYNVIYQVRDTSGNASNQDVLHVTVQ